MKKKIETLKSTMESSLDNHKDVVAALDRLNEEMGSEAVYPGDESLKTAIAETIDELENKDDNRGPVLKALSNRWDDLAEELEEWEMDHPGITLIIGDIARALAVCGL